ncbi:MAG TPA: lycopene cyclase domain-containing protein [Luteibaculaceae bacterium]|nr:lycopene cyclase domain-containing protein [Luteibaculaceae bacterium]
MKGLYLIVNLASISVPFIASFYPKAPFVKQWKHLFPALFATAAVFIIWDIWFTARGVWGFDVDYLIGTYFYNLPIEEVMFFICIPYCCAFIYFALHHFFPRPLLPKAANAVLALLGLFFLSVAVAHSTKAYPLSAGLAAYFVAMVMVLQKASWKGHYILTYTISIVPFLIVNGILTGTGLDKPIVWYNNDENLALRVLTIPVEDFIYSFAMQGMVILIYERLMRLKPKRVI